ncbi:hypothetical protein Clacol_007358 [Clathrus columnatus]|uniref:60S ribosomal protein L21 n=1 Tax=Clathrus columnatus TaxID=1419009 RepID=A0AAV5AK90_9AGAM|nr:hypothetical protein Clacol_007358 [Clathrus columnatus]
MVNKVVGNRYIAKRVNVRVEHVRHSKCRQEFLQRVAENSQKHREAKERGETAVLKRLPAGPTEAHVISSKDNLPQTMRPTAYETTI